MLRKTMIALLAAASVSLLAPGAASARGGFHGGGFHAGFGGFHGGFHHGGFGPGFALGAGLGLGFYAPYYYGGYYPYYGYPAYDGDDDDSHYDCHLVRRHVHTRYGWQWRTVQICN